MITSSSATDVIPVGNIHLILHRRLHRPKLKMLRGKSVHAFLLAAAAIFTIVLLGRFSTGSEFVPNTASIKEGISSAFGQSSLRFVMRQSERMWKKSVAQRHELREKYYPNGDLGFFPATNMPLYFTYPFSIWDLVPASYNCPFDVERIGRMGDGGKWVCGMSRYEANRKPCIMYSFGIQNESSFEQEMLERTNCEVWGYDFSVTKFGPVLQESMLPRTHFTQAGISGTTDQTRSPPFYSIQDLMAQNGHDYVDILKIDVEYAEFDTLVSLDRHIQDRGLQFPIGQMLMEIHLVQGSDKINAPQFLDWWEMLESQGIRPAWTEPNLLAVTLGQDGMPRLAEVCQTNIGKQALKKIVGLTIQPSSIHS